MYFILGIRERKAIVDNGTVNLIGNGWNYLHSCNAKYGNFSIVDSSNIKIVAFKVVHVGIGRQFKSNWEKRHNQQPRSKFRSVTNDCHTSK